VRRNKQFKCKNMDSLEDFKKENLLRMHYYGDLVRVFFLIDGILMLVSIPVFNDFLPVPAVISIAAVFFLVFVAGLTNPASKQVIILNVVASALSLIVFEYYAVQAYANFGVTTKLTFLFLVNQLLALVFLVALYFSVKTARGVFLK